MIIVEGSDRVGKTTLVEKIAKATGMRVLHWGLLPPDHDFFFDYVKHMAWDMIWDRGHWSEMAYQLATGRQQRVTASELRFVDTECFRWGCVYVNVTCSHSLLTRRLAERGDDKFSDDVVTKVNYWFRNSYKHYGPCDIRIDCFGQPGLEWPTGSHVKEIIKKHESYCATMMRLRERVKNDRRGQRYLSEMW